MLGSDGLTVGTVAGLIAAGVFVGMFIWRQRLHVKVLTSSSPVCGANNHSSDSNWAFEA